MAAAVLKTLENLNISTSRANTFNLEQIPFCCSLQASLCLMHFFLRCFLHLSLSRRAAAQTCRSFEFCTISFTRFVVFRFVFFYFFFLFCLLPIHCPQSCCGRQRSRRQQHAAVSGCTSWLIRRSSTTTTTRAKRERARERLQQQQEMERAADWRRARATEQGGWRCCCCCCGFPFFCCWLFSSKIFLFVCSSFDSYVNFHIC